ncbi:hypothetical protein ARHIZOSPH14_04650 [Agromyces rhizosphaerae]|uniref:Uncharacterized protein n=1 Tax=Agromyces rhizosphaerae TaxID=88374 RepID=A0A9W6FQM5_9MICO|nr:antitoxin [Agromyces rhizosphaerae]GLI26223.1 hypothetical protein ARHIZOSPH14_04650 [Agromyces rhizosphaerae]
MSDESRERRFVRRPRTGEDASTLEATRARFSESLDAIETFLGHAVAGGRAAFERNSPAYASGSMAIIRTAALFEEDEFRQFLGNVPMEVERGIATTRNIVSHSGYRAMNDDVFWATLTVHLPPYLATWRAAARVPPTA